MTDERRAALLPKRFSNKTGILENFPYFRPDMHREMSSSKKLIIYFNGSLQKERGIEFLEGLLDASINVEVIVAGWCYDKRASALIEHERVHYRGVVGQKESSEIASNECDYILCFYEPINMNYVYASPNKIFDAIQTGVPVIVNAEVVVSRFVTEESLGIVIPSYYSTNYGTIERELSARKGGFSFDSALKHKYSWESIEHKLLEAHMSN